VKLGRAATQPSFLFIKNFVESEMNNENFTGIRISKRDYFQLPATMRKIIKNKLMVLSYGHGKTFVPVIFIEL